MKDLLGNEVRRNDMVAYVVENKQGRTQAITGKVQGFNKRGCILQTKQGTLNVKNIIKIKTNVFTNVLNKIFN